MAPRPVAPAKKYFEAVEDARAKCKLCVIHYISCKGGSTKGLNTHLMSVHKIDVSKERASSEPGPTAPASSSESTTRSHPNEPAAKRQKTSSLTQTLVTDYLKKDYLKNCRSFPRRRSLHTRQHCTCVFSATNRNKPMERTTVSNTSPKLVKSAILPVTLTYRSCSQRSKN